MQSENMTSASNSLITAQFSTLDSTHSIFASSLSLPQQSSLTNPVTTP